MPLKARLKSLPLATYLVRRLRTLPYLFRSREAVFTSIYRRNAWGSRESASGPGSDVEQTRVIRQALPRLVAAHSIRILLDASCGDFSWMSLIEPPLALDRYIGVDIVAPLIAENQRRYGSIRGTARQFIHADIITDTLPPADLVLCRDCVMHLGYRQIFAALANFQNTAAAWLLITTFPGTTRNANIGCGGWWPMNLQLPPFNFPPPVELLNEDCPDPEGRRLAKSLGLWRLQELRLQPWSIAT